MYEFGAIVLVPFPFTDLSAAKVRPALVISKEESNSRDVIVSFITSRDVQETATTLALKPTASSGLKVPSLVRFDKIATLDKRLILGELGRVDPRVLRRYKERFMAIIGF